MALPFGTGSDRRDKVDRSAWHKAFEWFDGRRIDSFRKTRRRGPAGGLDALKIEALEPRFSLSADPAPFLVDMEGPTGVDYALRYDSLTQSLQLYDAEANTPILQRQVSEISYVKVQGSEFDDALTLDFSDGFVSPLDIRFDGGSDDDAVKLVDASLDTVSLTVDGEGAGQLEMADAGTVVTVALGGTEEVIDQTAATHRLYSDATMTGQHIRIQDNGDVQDGVGAIAEDSLIDYTFEAPTGLITIEGGEGDDTLEVGSVDNSIVGKVLMSGGAGTDTVTGPPEDSIWSLTGAGSGSVAGVSYVEVENLSGQTGNMDTFVVSESGSLTGVMDGGEGGFDTLVFDGGTFNSVEYVAFDLNSGTVTRDGLTLQYDGLEAINDNMSVPDRVIDLSAYSHTAEITQSGGGMTIEPQAPIDADFRDEVFQFLGNDLTFETINIGTLPSNSLTLILAPATTCPDFDAPIPFLSRDEVRIPGTVNLGTMDLIIDGGNDKDVVKIEGDLTVGDLTINAEIIEITDTGSVTSSGNVVLNADAEDDGVVLDSESPDFLQGIGLEGFFVAATEAKVNVAGDISATGTLEMTADGVVSIATSPGELAGVGVLDLTGVVVLPDVGVNVSGSAAISATSVTATAKVDVNVALADDADASDTSYNRADAAVSVVVVLGDSAMTVDGSSSITATAGAVTLGAVSELDV